MKRLTTKTEQGNILPLKNAVCGIDMPRWCLHQENDNEWFLIGDAVDKLAKYEDDEEAGRLIQLPCKVGDKIYKIKEFVYSDICEGCEFYYEGGMGDFPECNKTPYGSRPPKCMTIDERIADKDYIFHCLEYDLFGRFVFLTREEAEAALEKMKGK